MHHGLFLAGSRQVPLAYEYPQFISLLTSYCYLETVLTNRNLVFVPAVDNKSQHMTYRMHLLC